jgi:hypothetical protein
MTFKVFTVEYRVGVVCYDAPPQVVCTSMDDLISFCSLLERDKDVIEYKITSCGVTFSKKTLDAEYLMTKLVEKFNWNYEMPVVPFVFEGD